MKSKTSFFSRTLFLSQLKRFWPIYAAYLTAVVIALPVALSSRLSEMAADKVELAEITAVGAYRILATGSYAGTIISLVFGVMFAMAAFSFLYNARSVSMVCALPYKRTGIFVSQFAPGLCGMFFANLVAFLCGIAVCAGIGVGLTGVLLQWLAMMCLTNLFFYGFASLCASLTGHILVLPAIYAVLNFTAYVLDYVVRSILETFVYGLSMSSSSAVDCLSPCAYLMFNRSVISIYADEGAELSQITGYQYDGWLALIIYGIVGVLFAVCAMLLIKHRRMETAKDVVAVKPLKPVFKYCMTVGCALVIGMFVFNITFGTYGYSSGLTTMLTVLAFMVLGAFVGYFGSEMLLKKTLKVFKGRVWIGFAVSVAVIAGLMFACEYDLFGFEKYVPEAEQVESITIMCDGESGQFAEPENIAAVQELHKSIISNRSINESWQNGSMTDNRNIQYTVRMTYFMKDGSIVSRQYEVVSPATDDLDLIEKLLNTQEGIHSRYQLDFEVNTSNLGNGSVSYGDAEGVSREYDLTDEEAVDLYNNFILPDMQDGNIGTVVLDYNDEESRRSQYDCTIFFYLYDSSNLENTDTYTMNGRYFYVTPTVYSKRTNEWLSQHGIEPVLLSDSEEIYEKGMVARETTEVFGYDPADPDDNPAAQVVEVVG